MPRLLVCSVGVQHPLSHQVVVKINRGNLWKALRTESDRQEALHIP